MANLINLKQCPPLSNMPDLGLRHSHILELERYPVINLKTNIHDHSGLHLTSHNVSPRNLLMPVHENVLKRITHTFFESGFWESLAAARNDQTREEAPWISATADRIDYMLKLYKTLKLKIFPHTQELSVERIAQFVETRDWLNSQIRCIAWHLHTFKLAVAGADDVVRIYTKNNAAGGSILLKSDAQSQIACMAWRPLCAAELMVGCQQGLCLWTIDKNMPLMRNAQPNHIYQHPDKLPITSMQWNKDGTLLVTASIGHSALIMWQPDSCTMQPLRRMGPPASLLKWSPNNNWLFSGTVGRVFRVWSCNQNWSTERWVCNSGTVQTACWSPCGNFLLFVSTSEPLLYRLQFVKQHLLNSCDYDKDVLPIADLNACVLDSGSNLLIGGTAQQLAWDPHGNYLVISFKSTNCIAVFRTHIQKFNFQISPAYYLTGESPAEYPSFICFQPLYRENDRSVLTIGWSSGRIQFYPFD